jgi:dTDP-glucose pyrophosphorylase
MFRKTFLKTNSSIRDAMESLSSNSMGVVLVVDDGDHLLGIITDGDIRRGLLSAVSMDSSVEKIMSKNPAVLKIGASQKEILKMFKKHSLLHIPLVDDEGIVRDLKVLKHEVEVPEKENIVFINAGGKGQRLLPLTENCPKPLLQVGNKPILENIIQNFSQHGFKNFVISINHMADMVVDYFGDGSKWDVQISYIREDIPLGTAGAIGELREKLNLPIIVSNGDLLTNVDFSGLLDFHVNSKKIATMCVREYDVQVPYGVVDILDHKLVKIIEKPVRKFFINAGIYVLNPEAVKLIPQNQYFDMPTLFELILKQKQEVMTYPIHEYWLDIGRFDDFEKAQLEFSQVTGK